MPALSSSSPSQDGRVNAFYSTPSAYARAKLATTKFTLKTDDFFPYADCKNCEWAGYFVSRAALKGYVRDSSSYFNAARQMQVLTGGAADLGPSNTLYALERAVSLVTHHDGVSGTEKQAVAYGAWRPNPPHRHTSLTATSALLHETCGVQTTRFAWLRGGLRRTWA